MKHICAVIYICAVKCNAKTKKNQISEALPSVMTKTLGKETQFAECYYQETRRKAIFKKNQILFEKYLPSVLQCHTRHMFISCREQHSAKRIFKKPKYCLKNICRVSYSATLGICLSFAERSTRRKGILKTKKYFYKTICRVPCRLTLGEVTVNGGSGVTTVYFRRELNCTRQNVCRVPDKWHSAKLALPVLFMASAIRRVWHSVNYLPSVLRSLPSVSGTRQTHGVR